MLGLRLICVLCHVALIAFAAGGALYFAAMADEANPLPGERISATFYRRAILTVILVFTTIYLTFDLW